MIEKKVEPEKQVEPHQTSGQGSTTQEDVVKLLASILNQVQQQVQTPTLKGAALQAVERFKEIGAALALQRRPTITLDAFPTNLLSGGGTVKLTWSSTEAQTVSIDQKEKVGGVTKSLGEVGPVAGGSIENISVLTTTIFTATAKGLCSTTATVEVSVGGPF